MSHVQMYSSTEKLDGARGNIKCRSRVRVRYNRDEHTPCARMRRRRACGPWTGKTIYLPTCHSTARRPRPDLDLHSTSTVSPSLTLFHLIGVEVSLLSVATEYCRYMQTNS